jgi:type I protein arginine methyltransferase
MRLRGVAQPGSAPDWGSGGRWFESSRPDISTRRISFGGSFFGWVMDIQGFANPWEHVRLLSDEPRNSALVELINRHAPQARVLEVGCGTGLLSCIAARVGARKVYAVEPTPLWELAAELVEHNGLGDIVEVIQGKIEDLEPRPVDFAFSELLNADPFYEGVVPVSCAARKWVVEKGLLSPRRLRVYVALVRGGGSAREVRSALREVTKTEKQFDLDLSSLREALQSDESYRYMSAVEEPVSTTALAYDLELGQPHDLEEEALITVTALEPGPVAGAMVWFEAELDEGLIMSNPPGLESHWGQLVCGWANERGVRQGEQIQLRLVVDDDEMEVRRVG